jgi:hypothetical protein
VDEGIVEGCKDVGYAKYKLTFPNLWAEGHDLFFLRNLLFGRLSMAVISMDNRNRGRLVVVVPL